jgi:ring-1,2-phenylacetyl-CoA epoxidase subunit PaaD
VIAQRAALAQIWRWLDDVPDPEIPAISVVDLGIVRDVAWINGTGTGVLKVTVTPTYSGCPATRVIERDIERALYEHGIERVALETRLAPPWTTDWLSQAGREKLRAYGIAPPERGASRMLDITRFVEPLVSCPRCASDAVELTSRFGSTPCKALYRCTACREPFDHFKCH